MKKLLIALMFIPAMARAEFLTGNDLFMKLTGDLGDRMYALGYVVGIYDVNVHVTICPRVESTITAGQVKDIALQHLTNNPGQRHRNAESLVRESLAKVWPCQNRSSRNPV
jgi:hypothetical protein